MYCQRLAVKQIGSPTDQAQAVEETVTLLLSLEIDGEHSTERLLELESGIVDALHLRNLLQEACKVEGVLRLLVIAHLERL